MDIKVEIKGRLKEDISDDVLLDFHRNAIIFTTPIASGEDKGCYVAVDAALYPLVSKGLPLPDGTVALAVSLVLMERINRLSIIQNSIKMAS